MAADVDVLVLRSAGDFPDDLACSITHDLMADPVTTVQGNTYERAAIVEWLKVPYRAAALRVVIGDLGLSSVMRPWPR